jgi:opacity protein-like surface antigen
MRLIRPMGLSLLVTLALTTTATAQSFADRLTFNAAVGPSFANLGTTFNATGGVDVRLNDRTSLVGEFGVLPHAPFEDAARIAAPSLLPSGGSRVNAYHWNGNVKFQPFAYGRFQPYVTGGLGRFTTDTLGDPVAVGTSTVQDRRRVSDFASNVGAGLVYRLNDWVGLSAEYRTFFVHRDGDTPLVNRLTTGITFSVK